jgi:hypothetical protein
MGTAPAWRPPRRHHAAKKDNSGGNCDTGDEGEGLWMHNNQRLLFCAWILERSSCLALSFFT